MHAVAARAVNLAMRSIGLAGRWLLPLLVAVTGAIGAIGAGDAAAADTGQAGVGTGQAACEGLRARASAFHDRSVRLLSSTFIGAGAPAVPAGQPAHCEVVGTMQERDGRNGQHYAIRFHMRLPVAWNYNFFFQGGGGSNGELGDALGRLGEGQGTALAQGYAVISQDSGHDNRTNADPSYNGQLAFGFDPEARANYGHASLEAVAQAGKDLIVAYYHDKPRHSYFVGCSKGGQEGMMFAQRYPEVFDGIVASAPGFALPRAALAEAWDTQAFGALVRGQGAAGFDVKNLYKSFSAGDFALVRSAILEACDADDGLRDGIVGDTLRCTDARVVPQLRARACKADKVEGCLSEAQIGALLRSHGGPRNSRGEQLYSSWPWPSGIVGEGWRIWKIGSSDGHVPPLNVVLGAGSLAAVFTSPPTALGADPQALANYQVAFDFDRDAARIDAVVPPFRHSAWADVGARSADLSAFRARGGRLIVPHGESDPVFSLNDTLDWYRQVDARSNGEAASFVRVFPVPGMCHCGGGQSTDAVEAFPALVAWVEQGKAPASLRATAGPSSPWPGRERPVCAYPAVARYKGTGDPEKASSFVCRT
jgi:hypothetical protein